MRRVVWSHPAKLALLIAVFMGTWFGLSALMRLRVPATPPPPRYADLDDVLAEYRRNRWVVAVQPRLPGPYRMVDAAGLTRNGGKITWMIRDEHGTIKSEALEAAPDFDQTLIHLETWSGLQTIAVLSRRDAPP